MLDWPQRYCMGELLARNEIFLFAAALLQRLQFLPPTAHPQPDTRNYTANLTRIPDDFHMRITHPDL